MSKLRIDTEEKRIHYNIPQLTYHLIRAAITVCLWARATGKTIGPGSDFIYHNLLTMPRSLGGIASSTYDKLLTMIIPKLKMGWERMGLVHGIHFWLRRYAPEHYRRPRPILEPTDPKNVVHWWNGSAQLLISLDRFGISNALDIDYLYADEAKLFDYEKFKETLLTVRGNASHFGHLAEHGSVLITTDLPTNSKGKWLFGYLDQVDDEAIDLILMIQKEIFILNSKLSNANQNNARKIETAIRKYEADINEIRKNLVYVSFASTLDNVHALGIDTIKKFKRTLKDLAFRVSVLNERITQIENGFYATLDETIHGYSANNYEYQNNLNLNFDKPVLKDCRWDSDLRNAPLDIAFDHNSAINWIVTGQDRLQTNQTRLLSALFVEYPDKLKHLLKKWCDYYQYHPVKVVNYYYDHTSIPENASTDVSFADEVIKHLDRRGWQVNKMYIGQAASHRARYIFWQKLLDEHDHELPNFRYNTSNCEEWQIAMEQTGTKVGKDSFQKNKDPEKNKNYPQVEAPHATDASDTLLWGKHKSNLRKSRDFVDIIS